MFIIQTNTLTDRYNEQTETVRKRDDSRVFIIRTNTLTDRQTDTMHRQRLSEEGTTAECS